MVDIDFGKVARRKVAGRPTRVVHASSKTHKTVSNGLSNKLYVYFSFAIIIFTSGLLAGISYQKNKVVNLNESNGITTHADLGDGSLTQNQRTQKSLATTLETGLSEGKRYNTYAKPAQENSNVNILEKKLFKNKQGQSKTLKDVMTTDKRSYHILAKKYNSEKMAIYYGKELQNLKLGVKIFLARSRKKMKVYVGPIQGKKPAYKLMKIIKSIPEFKGAILYEN